MVYSEYMRKIDLLFIIPLFLLAFLLLSSVSSAADPTAPPAPTAVPPTPTPTRSFTISVQPPDEVHITQSVIVTVIQAPPDHLSGGGTYNILFMQLDNILQNCNGFSCAGFGPLHCPTVSCTFPPYQVLLGPASILIIRVTSADTAPYEIDKELTINGSVPTPTNVPTSPTEIPPPPACTTPGTGGECAGVDTAIGPASTTPNELITTIMRILLSISGGIALLLLIYAGYKILTSRGNPETVKGARELITSAIAGLLLIILSLVILEVLGVDILHIPGFSH